MFQGYNLPINREFFLQISMMNKINNTRKVQWLHKIFLKWILNMTTHREKLDQERIKWWPLMILHMGIKVVWFSLRGIKISNRNIQQVSEHQWQQVTTSMKLKDWWALTIWIPSATPTSLMKEHQLRSPSLIYIP